MPRVIEENAYLKKYNKELIKFGFSALVELVSVFVKCYKKLNSSY